MHKNQSYSKFLFEIIKRNISLTNKTKEFKIGYISGIIDSEGYVNPKKYMLMVISTNLKMLEDCQNLLKSLKITSTISERKMSIKGKLKSYRMYISVSFKRLNHLSVKAGNLK